MKTFSILCFGAVLILSESLASAWMRMRYEDAQVVARSELIVVGGIKPDSLEYIPHKEAQGMWWEHRATLVVHQVLKGKCEAKEIPIIIHYGLEPLVGGHTKHDGHEVNVSTTGPASAIEIVDDADEVINILPRGSDARDDNIWCLRRGSGIHGEEPGNGDLGIADPEDLQPLGMKDYLNCYLSKDPESAVRAQMQKQPDISDRAVRYLQHLQVQRILTEPDRAIRVERLLPYFQARTEWGDSNEASAGIIAAGAVAGPYLMGLYKQTWDPNRQEEIIRMWGQIRYAGCVDLLIDLLKTQDDYWSRQKLTPGWWNDDNPSRAQWQNNYGLVFSAVYALEQIHDLRANDAIELTRRRWDLIQFENPQIVEECDKTLKSFASENAPESTKP
jgi:hypothetical protein